MHPSTICRHLQTLATYALVESGTLLRRKDQGKSTVVMGHFETRAKLLETNRTDLTSKVEISLLSLCLSHRHMEVLQQIYALPLIASDELMALFQREGATQQRGVRQALQTPEHTAGVYRFLAHLQIQAREIGQELLW